VGGDTSPQTVGGLKGTLPAAPWDFSAEPEVPPDGVPSEHVPTRREAARRQFADLLEAVTADD
jgi:hypothetical protein